MWFITLLFCTSFATAAESPQKLSMTQAVDVALSKGLETRISEQGIMASKARVKGAWAQVLPKLHADSNVLRWNKPLLISTGPGSEALVVREQITSTTSLTLSQTITGLGYGAEGISMTYHDLDAAKAEDKRAELDTINRTVSSYLRALEAEDLLKVAQKSLVQTEEQLRLAETLEKTGALARVDTLRFKVARDTAKQYLINAESNVVIAHKALALNLNMPAESQFEINDDLPEKVETVTLSEADATASAVSQNPNLEAAKQRAMQAENYQGVTTGLLFPNISGVLTYQHAEGMGSFQPKDAWYLGAVLNWDVWDWGKNWQSMKEAKANATQAQLVAQNQENQVRFAAQEKRLKSYTAYESLGIAKSGLEVSEEAYRIQQLRFQNGAATTTDMLEAETEIARSRANYTAARYEYYIALADLARAMGLPPSFIAQTVQ